MIPLAQDWYAQAACRSEDPFLFVEPDGRENDLTRWNREAAKAICSRCPAAGECLTFAIAIRATGTIWGGLTTNERQAERRRRTRRKGGEAAA